VAACELADAILSVPHARLDLVDDYLGESTLSDVSGITIHIAAFSIYLELLSTAD
jgi:hypothetical protein